MESPISVEVVPPPNLAEIAAKLGRGTELRREFGKKMRDIARDAVKAERAAVMGISSKARHTKRQRAMHAANQLRNRKNITDRKIETALKGAGLRKSIANSINAIIRYQGADVGVRIRAQSSKMPPGMQRLPQLTNKGSWTHPILGKAPGSVRQTTSPPQWWSKTRDQVRQKARADFDQLLQEYAKKIV